jgi:integrase
VAQWVTRPRTDGGTSFQIKWRMDGRWQSETFTDPRLAAEFRAAVEQAGHCWPEGWVKGEGWALDVPAEPEPVKVTFAEVADGPGGYFAWQAKRARLGKVKPRTIHDYRRVYELHLEENFGSQAFEAIDINDLADWVEARLADGAAPKTVRDQHGLLSSIMKHGAMRMKLRPDNPCKVTELPDLNHGTSQVRQMRFLQPAEWALFRSHLLPDIHLALDLDLATGLRWGELSALRVGDITFRPTTDGQVQANLHIVRAWSRRAPDDPAPIRWDQAEDYAWVLGPPKSKRPRWVAAAGDVATQLQQAVAGRGPDDYVFLTRDAGPWRYGHFHERRWLPARKAAEAAGLTKKVTPHMLRHTTVVWSLAEGVPIEKVSEMIGHASLQITYDIYGGLINLHDPAMAQAMARAMITLTSAGVTTTAPSSVRRPAAFLSRPRQLQDAVKPEQTTTAAPDAQAMGEAIPG